MSFQGVSVMEPAFCTVKKARFENKGETTCKTYLKCDEKLGAVCCFREAMSC